VFDLDIFPADTLNDLKDNLETCFKNWCETTLSQNEEALFALALQHAYTTCAKCGNPGCRKLGL
jgi:hypothetical protein